MAKKKWIQDAINPAHKGYCTPMSKKTCTPHRKALAKRFKSGDLHKAQTGGDIPKYQTAGKSKVFVPGATYDTDAQQGFDRMLQEDVNRQIREQTPTPDEFMQSERGKQVIDKYKPMGYDVRPGQDGKLKFTKNVGDSQLDPNVDIFNKLASGATAIGNMFEGAKLRGKEKNQINESMTPKYFQNMQAQGLNNVPAYMEYGGDITLDRQTYYGNGLHGEGTSYPVKQVTTGSNFQIYSRGIDSDTASTRTENDVPVANPKWLSGTGQAIRTGRGPRAMFGGHDNDFNRQPVMEYGGWEQVGFMLQNGGHCDDCVDQYMYGGMGEGLPYDERDMTNVDFGYQGIRQQIPYGRNSMYQTGGKYIKPIGPRYNFGYMPMHRTPNAADSAVYKQIYEGAIKGDPKMLQMYNEFTGNTGGWGENPLAGATSDPRYKKGLTPLEYYNQAETRRNALINAAQDANVPAPFGSAIEFKTGGKVSKEKAKQILKDDSAQGHPLTAKQKRYFGWIAGGSKPRAEYGGWGQEGFMMQTGGFTPQEQGIADQYRKQGYDVTKENGQLKFKKIGAPALQQQTQPQQVPIQQRQQTTKQQVGQQSTGNHIPLPDYANPESRLSYAKTFRDKYGKDTLKGYGDIPLRVNEKPSFATDTSRNLATKAASSVGLDPALFYASSMIEGQSGLYPGAAKTEKGEDAIRGYTGDKDYPVSGLWAFGLDSFQDYYPTLKKKGYLPKDFDKQFKIYEDEGGPMGPDADPESVMFKSTDAGVQAKAAMMRAFYDELDDYSKKKHINLTPEQRDFFALAHFNSGKHGYEMLDAYNKEGLLKNNKFLEKRPNIPIKGVSEKLHKQIYGNVAPRLAAARGLKEEGLFENGDEAKMKYGGYDPELADGYVPEFATGGKWIQSAIKHPGRCANPGDENCPKGSPQYNLAMRFKHGDLHKKQAGGYTHDSRKLPYYQTGGYGIGDEIELTAAQIKKLREQGYQIEEI